MAKWEMIAGNGRNARARAHFAGLLCQALQVSPHELPVINGFVVEELRQRNGAVPDSLRPAV